VLTMHLEARRGDQRSSKVGHHVSVGEGVNDSARWQSRCFDEREDGREIVRSSGPELDHAFLGGEALELLSDAVASGPEACEHLFSWDRWVFARRVGDWPV